MQKKWIAAAGALTLAVVLVLWALPGRGADAGSEYRFATVERGDLRAAVSATGALSAVTTVQVGSELGAVKYPLEVARANVRSADVAVERARRNLGYTEIYAPIDGIVVERNVDVGQTVAASLSAPQLFLIAQDLSHMQILASVDESDIGDIHEGQPVQFKVQAYPDEKFSGVVKQVRLQSSTQENVVSYTAVVSLENTSGRLLPGMTATVEFVTGEAQNALTVPNAALRFRPTQALPEQAGGPPAGVTRGNAASPSAASTSQRAGATRARAADASVLWYLKDGKPAPVRVRTGLTDGQRTVVEGEELAEGNQIIIGTRSGGDAGSAANPFGGQQQPQRGPPAPGGF
jgi:HlyD family secretion protein